MQLIHCLIYSMFMFIYACASIRISFYICFLHSMRGIPGRCSKFTCTLNSCLFISTVDKMPKLSHGRRWKGTFKKSSQLSFELEPFRNVLSLIGGDPCKWSIKNEHSMCGIGIFVLPMISLKIINVHCY